MIRSACAIIQARLDSARLYGKILMDVAGVPLLRHVIDRAKAIVGVDDVVLAVPDESTRQRLQALFPAVRVFSAKTSAPENVLGRFAEVARQFRSHDVFLRLTADNPFLAPEVAVAVLELYHRSGCDYASNDIAVSGYPDGVDVEVFSREILGKADAATDLTNYDKEHVGPWMKRHGKTELLKAPEDWSRFRLTVDTPEDLTRVRAIAARLKPGDYSLAATLKAATAKAVTP